MKLFRNFPLIVLPILVLELATIFTSCKKDDTRSIPDGSVMGIVTDDATSQPIGGATLALTLKGASDIRAVATSDADGKYVFAEVAPGGYDLRISSDGYAPVTVDVTVGSGETTQKDVTLTAHPGSVSGIVKDLWDNSPVKGATVTLAGNDGSTASATTDDNGHYTVEVAPGTYTLSCEKDDYLPADPAEVTVTADRDTADDVGIEPAAGQWLKEVQMAICYNAADEPDAATFRAAQNLSADMFGGYFHDPSPALALKNSVYDFDREANSTMWKVAYDKIMPLLAKVEAFTEGKYPDLYAAAKILKVEAMQRVSDLYGPILYKRYGSVDPTPNTQEELYEAFYLQDLPQAAALLKNFNGSGHLGAYDILMPEGKRNPAQWLKFANSLRMRLAIRISSIAPQQAQKLFEQALSAEAGGVLEDPSDVVAVSADGTGYVNPLGVLAAKGSVKMNATMESFLRGYADPRLKVYFKPATATAVAGEYRGIRQGTGFTGSGYEGMSDANILPTDAYVLMRASEVWFLRAEAALRGWNAGGKIADLYDQAVRCSFAERGVTGADDYLNSEAVPADFVDAFESSDNIRAVSTITPKWDDNDRAQDKQERLAIQKWIAIFPDGCEAWAEQRRVGCPKLFPVKVNHSGSTIDAYNGPRRLAFPEDPGMAYEDLVNKLGGTDNGATRLWWDTGRPY